jgi:hypothetical protein
VKQKISIVLEAIVVTLVFLLASGSIVESYNQVFGWYKGVHRGHHSYHHHHAYHGYRHYGHYGSRPFGHRDSGGHSRPGGPIGNKVNGTPGYYGHRNYVSPISWHPKSPIFCHGNPIVCHTSTPTGSGSRGGGNISPGSPITPVTPVISHPIAPASPIGSGSPGGGNISPVTPIISHPGGSIVGAESPISPSSPGDPGGGGFPGGPVGIPSF